MQRDVAVKVIKPELVDNPEFIRRFEIEAQLVARLEHLHIVPLHDYWRDADGAYLVMRLLGGGNLKDALSDGSFTVAQTVKVAQEIGGALAAAHSSGVVHRDIKPANVLLDDAGNTYLSDFGIAKDLGSDAAVTRSGQALGSPAYMAPEQLRSEPPSPQTDIYALGLLVYEMLAGSHPFDIDSLVRLIDDQMTAPLPALEGEVEGVPTGIDEVLGRATAKPPLQRFSDVSEFLEALVGVAGPDVRAERVVPLSAPNLFKGLRAFQESDAADFFGRTELIDRFVGRLDGERFLAVVGPSGSGKSSVVRAGLMPALRSGVIDGSESWLVADFIPGLRPFEELEAALLRVAVNPPSTLLEQLQRDEGGLRSVIKRILPPGTELLLVIDQFEEVFTLTDDATRDLFVANLLGAIGDERTPIRLVVTLRADFYDRPLQFEELGELMRTRTETVLPLGRAGIEEAVTGPASRVGVPVDPDLVPEIAADLADEPGALPLLQYALTQVFDARRGGNLSVETYRDVGGVSGALAKRAEELYAGLDEDNRAATRQVFLQLVTLGEGTGDTRRRVPVPDLEALGTVRGILSVYGDARLLSFDRDPTTRTPTVEVAHEALLTEWDTLRAWIDESRDDLRTHRRLSATAADWKDSGGDPSFLLTGSRLTNLREWANTTTLTNYCPGADRRGRAGQHRVAEQRHRQPARWRHVRIRNRFHHPHTDFPLPRPGP